MLIQENNKWKFVSQLIAESWIMSISLTVFFASLISFFCFGRLVLFLVIAAISGTILTIQTAASVKVRDRLLIHKGFYFLKFKLQKKAQIPMHTVLLLDNCLEFKKQYYIGFEISSPDYYSLSGTLRENANLLYAQFIYQLPVGTEIILISQRDRTVENNVQDLLTSLDLSLPLEYRKFYAQKYYLVIRSKKTRSLIEVSDYIHETKIKIKQLTNQQLITVICD